MYASEMSLEWSRETVTMTILLMETFWIFLFREIEDGAIQQIAFYSWFKMIDPGFI
jgi:hypothetical protein